MLKRLAEQEIFRIEIEIQALPGDSRCPSDVIHGRLLEAVPQEDRCREPGALLLVTFIGQSRFDEIRCRARRSASPSGCPLRFVKPGAARRPLRHFGERPMDNPSPGVMPRPAL